VAGQRELAVNGTRALVIAAIASFIVGCSVGLISGVLIMRFGGPPRFATHGPREHGPRGERLLATLSRSLDLTDEQRRRIGALIEDTRHAQGASHDSLRARIARELTPEQRERWERFEERFSRRGRRGPPRD
jgi:Spy/CpxP family protein refolding chaperone